MTETERKFKQILNFYKMSSPEFFPQSIVHFQDFAQEIKQSLTGLICSKKKQSVQQATNKLIEFIHSSAQEMSLNCIVKKLAILHSLVNKSRLKQLGELLKECIIKQINVIINSNLQEITVKQPQKRQSSLSKVQGLIRKLSGSKERSHSKNGKMFLQNQKEKGALVQIVNKIVRPFCFYLLKLLQDFDIYWKVKTNTAQNESATLWKIINWSKTLGSIIIQIHRLGRYFREDMLTLSVYFNYLICLDISDYYDIAKKYVEKESEKWKQTIKRVKKEQRENKEQDPEMHIEMGQQAYRQIVIHPQLVELKELITQVRTIKERLNYVYGNSMLTSWQTYFTRPSKFSFNSKVTKEEATMDFILEFFQKQNREKEKNKLLNQSYYGKFESISKCDTEQTLSKDSPKKQKLQKKSNSLKKEMISGCQIFEDIGQNSFLSKVQKVKMVTSRLNKFLHPTIEKQKLMNQITLFNYQDANKIQYRTKDKANPVFHQ